MVKRLRTYKKISSQGIFMWNIKALALTIQKLLARLKFSKSRSNSKVKVTRSKLFVPMRIFMWNIKALALTVQKLLARLMFKIKISKTPGSGSQNKQEARGPHCSPEKPVQITHSYVLLYTFLSLNQVHLHFLHNYLLNVNTFSICCFF